jgi:putative Ca2+/H+ antiporter (TMEM165/GDT1 family)
MFGDSAVLSALVTVGTAIFIAELTDKDALLLLSLATRIDAWVVFAAGSLAFTITSAIIVTVGQLLVTLIPVSLITLVGGTIMIGYGVWSFFHSREEEEELTKSERNLVSMKSKGVTSVFFGAVAMLILLDLAGDATEILTILFVARYGDALVVFTGAVIALVTASAVETTLGNKLSKILSPDRIRILSLIVFLVIGVGAILSVIFHI